MCCTSPVHALMHVNAWLLLAVCAGSVAGLVEMAERLGPDKVGPIYVAEARAGDFLCWPPGETMQLLTDACQLCSFHSQFLSTVFLASTQQVLVAKSSRQWCIRLQLRVCSSFVRLHASVRLEHQALCLNFDTSIC